MIKLIGRTLSILFILCITLSLEAQNKWTEAECVTIETGTRTFYLHKNSPIRVHYKGGKIHSRIKSIGKDHFITKKGDTKVMFDDIKKMRIYNSGKLPLYSLPSGFVMVLISGTGIGTSLDYRDLPVRNTLGSTLFFGGAAVFAYGLFGTISNLISSKIVEKSANKAKHDIQSIKKGEHRNEYVKPIGF